MDLQDHEHKPSGLYGEDNSNQPNSFGSASAKQSADIESSGSQSTAASSENKQTGCCGFLTIEYYQPFFEVTTAEVKRRIFNVFVPNKPEFQDGPKKNPDLWGPFWTLTTVVFLLFVCGNLSSYISGQKEHFSAEFGYVPAAAALIYGIGIGFPIILSILIKCFGGETSPIEAICLYGYSMACYAVVAILSSIPFSWLQWILAIYGFLNSTIFIIVNIHGDIRSLPSQKKYIVLGLIGAFQLGLMLLFKFYFFDVFNQETKEAAPSNSNSTSTSTSP